ncbi:MAG: hypothetical protein A3H70_04680 [Candidatus Komeilibacteria bacterium RIFCSPLOWO2_02_FULL_48_11]|uniref:PNPLA domain-containing protein n=1 Tax=Candidatus Komeilibacteria bacterium RIFCSPLOWO2_02_FULL_48_11 TaxID=1798553 RepID=A0A1G2BVC4_9BACT|nr:MAG: hypothetical protein A3H70_04680 [Candidatus Komeilibacteria bacterium RIFCSPLOWO2_02_FULL_48_11]
MEKKLAIIASGGGMKSSYTVGALTALFEQYPDLRPDIVVAGSGSAGTLAYYVAGQFESGKNIWFNLLSTSKFINPLRLQRVIDIDYLIDVVFKQQQPLDIVGMRQSPILFNVGATNRVTGEVTYFSNRDAVDFFEVLRASKAMPIAYRKSVAINGVQYYDSYLSSGIRAGVRRALELGAERLLLFNTDIQSWPGALMYRAWLAWQAKEFRDGYQKEKEAITRSLIPDRARLVMIQPRQPLPVSTLNNNRAKIHQTIEQGYQETLNNQELKEFILKDL